MFAFNTAKIGSRVFFETGFSHDWCLPSIGVVENVSHDADGNPEILYVLAGGKRVVCGHKAVVSVLNN